MKDTRRFYKVDGLLFQPLFFLENAEQLVKTGWIVINPKGFMNQWELLGSAWRPQKILRKRQCQQ